MVTVPPVSRPPIILPSRGVARVKSVLSGDTVILLGKAQTPNGKAPEVIFTLENISAPRYVVIGFHLKKNPGRRRFDPYRTLTK